MKMIVSFKLIGAILLIASVFMGVWLSPRICNDRFVDVECVVVDRKIMPAIGQEAVSKIVRVDYQPVDTMKYVGFSNWENEAKFSSINKGDTVCVKHVSSIDVEKQFGNHSENYWVIMALIDLFLFSFGLMFILIEIF
jgi:hypothetical protein